MTQKWVCQTWKEQPDMFESPHVFDENTSDGFCPEDPPYHGILLRETMASGLSVSITFPESKQTFVEGTNITILAETSDGDFKVEFFVDDRQRSRQIAASRHGKYLSR